MIGQPTPPQMGAPQGPPPGMMLNPAFMQWRQMQAAWQAEKQRREQEFTAACDLIKSDAAKRFKIDIEADSTVAADEQAEKQARTEFMTAMVPLLEGVLPQIQTNPALAPLIKELVMFSVRAFRVSRQLEESFETALDKMIRSAGQGGPPGQEGGKNTKSPMEIQAEAGEAQLKAQTAREANAVKMTQISTDAAIEQAKLASQEQKNATELALRGREMEGREALENARIQHMAARDTRGLV
jgi:hypothetical protein